MRANRPSATKPEVRLRSELHRRGARFRKNALLRVDGVAIRPDILFSGKRVAVFVDGCFWHRCPEHATTPKANRAFWLAKFERNRERDARANALLNDAGWVVVRVWEHESVATAASRVLEAIERQSAGI